RFRHRILQGRSISEKQIQATVVVVVNHGNAPAYRLQQILHRRKRRRPSKINPGRKGNVAEGDGRLCLRGGWWWLFVWCFRTVRLPCSLWSGTMTGLLPA